MYFEAWVGDGWVSSAMYVSMNSIHLFKIPTSSHPLIYSSPYPYLSCLLSAILSLDGTWVVVLC